MVIKNGIYTNYIGDDIPDIRNRKETDCCFFNDGEAHRRITEDILYKIESGMLVVTEYVDSPLGGTYHIDAASQFN